MHNLVLVCCVHVMCWSADYHVTVIQGGLSALMLCCESGNCEMAELLLKSQADPDLQQSVSHTHRQALHMCICTLCTILLHRTQDTLLSCLPAKEGILTQSLLSWTTV